MKGDGMDRPYVKDGHTYLGENMPDTHSTADGKTVRNNPFAHLRKKRPDLVKGASDALLDTKATSGVKKSMFARLKELLHMN